jgi:hypothetical protein
MGMDIYGRNPTSEAGKYFQANIWSWRAGVERSPIFRSTPVEMRKTAEEVPTQEFCAVGKIGPGACMADLSGLVQ